MVAIAVVPESTGVRQCSLVHARDLSAIAAGVVFFSPSMAVGVLNVSGASSAATAEMAQATAANVATGTQLALSPPISNSEMTGANPARSSPNIRLMAMPE